MTQSARLFAAALLAVVVGACGSAAGPPTLSGPTPSTLASGADGRTGIRGTATAGPVCPVERIPPDPSCAARPVAGATVSVRDPAGVEVARVTTGADGTYFVAVAAGAYLVSAEAVDGLMRAPGPQETMVEAGRTSTVDLSYDTGIR
jgi:hypothetical protein